MVCPGSRVGICKRLLCRWSRGRARKGCLYLGFLGLAILLNLVETTGTWPQGLLDAYIAMIPEADGDSTPLGQRPLSVLPVVPFGLDICESGLRVVT